MLPKDLQAESFSRYPPGARGVAVEQIDLLRRMPLAFVPLLLREVVAYDWKFPAERAELDGQFRFLRALPPGGFAAQMKPFDALRLTPELEAVDWVNVPAQFSEQLSAHLWATHQIEAFRAASVEYVHRVNGATKREGPALPRLSLIVLGQGVQENKYRLFRKLRPHGTYFSNVKGGGGRALFIEKLNARAHGHAEAFGHWYVDGAAAADGGQAGVSFVSYQGLNKARGALVDKMRRTMQPGGGGPEALRTMMAAMSPADIGLGVAVGSEAGGEVLSRFQLSLLTEGSGTQLFSTTFVQWAAREILRRAQPVTLLTCYAPRQREQSMQEMLSGAPHQTVLDPHGSLIDADMGAYYTWINQQRLTGAQEASFVAWFEGHGEAMAVGPGFTRGQEKSVPVELREILARVS